MQSAPARLVGELMRYIVDVLLRRRTSGVIYVFSRLVLAIQTRRRGACEAFGFGGEVRQAKDLIGAHAQGKGWGNTAHCLYTRRTDFQSYYLPRQL